MALSKLFCPFPATEKSIGKSGNTTLTILCRELAIPRLIGPIASRSVGRSLRAATWDLEGVLVSSRTEGEQAASRGEARRCEESRREDVLG